MFEAQAQCDLLHPEREDQTVLDELKFNIGSEAFEAMPMILLKKQAALHWRVM